MKKVICVILILIMNSFLFGQNQNIVEDDYQIGMLNQSSSERGFIYNLKKKKMGLKVSTLPFYSEGHKVYSSMGVSGLFNLKNKNRTVVYSYAGVQSISTKIGKKANHLNLSAGLGVNTKLQSSIELLCQVGYSNLNSFQSNQLSTVVSEVGFYYFF
ncbi:MAG: hypothetical protein AB8B74_05680 [Crocinitomicaceae bacterium]